MACAPCPRPGLHFTPYALRPTFYALRFTYEHPTRPPGLASYRVLAGLSAPQVLSDPHGAAIALDEGWHLVSLPEEPVDSDPAVVLASIAESYARVYAYDGCDPADPWKVYDPAHPETSDLRVIDHTKGLWIEMTAPGTLRVSGSRPENTVVRLCAGWNLVGYPLAVAMPVAGALASVAGRYDRVFAWDGGDANDLWAFFDVTVEQTWANELRLMKPGQGYWVHATAEAALVLSAPRIPPEMEVPGFIAAPAVRSRVTGTVAIVLAEGVILHDATVDYWPADDLGAVQVLAIPR